MRGLTPARALLAGLAAAQIAFGRDGRRRSPAATRRMLVAMLSVSGVEAAEARGARGVSAMLLSGSAGFLSELVGVASGRPFGRYSYSDQLGPRLRGVPLLAAAAWAIMARPAWVAAGWIHPGRRVRIPVAAAALAAWDVYLDPRMTEEGYWHWPGGGRYAGVPASNFVGWFLVGALAFTLVSGVDGAAPDERDDAALALYAWTWIGEGIANGFLWRRPLVAVAGASAMGSVAVPALCGRMACPGRG